jgi:hypothetical protein
MIRRHRTPSSGSTALRVPLLGDEQIEAKKVLGILPGTHAGKACLPGQRVNLLLIVLVRTVCVDLFTLSKMQIKISLADMHRLLASADKMHLHTSQLLIVDCAIRELAQVKIRPYLAIQTI